MNRFSWMKRLACALLAVALAACAAPAPLQPTGVPSTPKTQPTQSNAPVLPVVVQSQKARQSGANVSAADRAELAAGNNAFALDLYHQLAGSDGNLFYSPYSISLALAMTQAGAKGSTLDEMNRVLHFTLPPERLHPAFNALDQELASRKDRPGYGADGKGFRLNIANDIWGQKDYTFLPAYLDVLSANYGAGMRLVDFRSNPEAARLAINQYIAGQTEQRIKDLLAQGTVDSATRLVLTNAIYFNAAWAYPFDAGGTENNAPFTRLDKSTVSVPMMRAGAESIPYLAGEGFHAAALPYEGWQLSMVVLLPDAGQFADFESKLDAGTLEKILTGLRQDSRQVAVKLPRFQMEDEFALGQMLEKMGMKDALTPGAADFSGMDGTRNLYISDVVHKTFVKVDEQGTEAAAATAVMVAAGAMPGEPVQFTVDRPFLFLIVDQPTNTVLFMGRVTDPSAE